MLKHQEILTVEGTYIEMILNVLGLSEKDMLEDPFYLKELAIRPYAIDTLVNLLMRKEAFLVIDGIDDYRILRPFGGNDNRTQLEALADYYELIAKRWGKNIVGRDEVTAGKVGKLLT